MMSRFFVIVGIFRILFFSNKSYKFGHKSTKNIPYNVEKQVIAYFFSLNS